MILLNFFQLLSTIRRRTRRTSSTWPGSPTTGAAASSSSPSSCETNRSGTVHVLRPDSTRNDSRPWKSSWSLWADNTFRDRMANLKEKSSIRTSRSGSGVTPMTMKVEGKTHHRDWLLTSTFKEEFNTEIVKKLETNVSNYNWNIEAFNLSSLIKWVKK